MRTFKNENPTRIEQMFFDYAGFYLTEKNDEKMVYTCVDDVGKQKEFPKSIQTELADKKGEKIIFYQLCECISFEGDMFLDTSMLHLILERTKELGWSLFKLADSGEHFERQS